MKILFFSWISLLVGHGAFAAEANTANCTASFDEPAIMLFALHYDTDFDVARKVVVNGEQAHAIAPLKSPDGKRNYEVLEKTVYPPGKMGAYRIRMIFAADVDCTLMGQEILDTSSL